jgi:hypothetical protein
VGRVRSNQNTAPATPAGDAFVDQPIRGSRTMRERQPQRSFDRTIRRTLSGPIHIPEPQRHLHLAGAHYNRRPFREKRFSWLISRFIFSDWGIKCLRQRKLRSETSLLNAIGYLHDFG